MDLKNYLSKPGNTQTALAAKLKVSQGLIHQWAEGRRPVSPTRCVELEFATSGAVTRKDLRPDDWHQIWPELVTEKRSISTPERRRAPGRRETDKQMGRRTRKSAQP